MSDEIQVAVKGEKLLGILSTIELVCAALEEVISKVEANTIALDELPDPVSGVVALL